MSPRFWCHPEISWKLQDFLAMNQVCAWKQSSRWRGRSQGKLGGCDQLSTWGSNCCTDRRWENGHAQQFLPIANVFWIFCYSYFSMFIINDCKHEGQTVSRQLCEGNNKLWRKCLCVHAKEPSVPQALYLFLGNWKQDLANIPCKFYYKPHICI